MTVGDVRPGRLAGSPGHGVHGQQNLAQAYLGQATNGPNGPGYMGS